MAKNIYLFIGEGKYLLDQEIHRRKQGFADKFGKNSIFYFMSENFDSNLVLESIFAGGLFTNKKMVIIKGVPLDSDQNNKLSTMVIDKFVEEFFARDCKVPDDVLLIFVSYKPDKRTKLYKKLLNIAEIKEFKSLTTIQIKLFIKEKLENIIMDEKILDYFLIKVGKNLYNIENEIDKLKNRCIIKNIMKIDEKIIDQVVYGKIQINSFLFFDYFLTDKNKLMKVWEKIQEEGSDFNQILGMLYWGIKLYLFMIDLYKQGITDSKIISKTIKYHPFAVSKNMHNIKKILDNEEKIKLFYRDLVDIDYDIKTGKMLYTYFGLSIKKLLVNY